VLQEPELGTPKQPCRGEWNPLLGHDSEERENGGMSVFGRRASANSAGERSASGIEAF
jgi:hypothetical protein